MGWRELNDTLNSWGERAGLRKLRDAISPWNVVSPTDVASFAPGGGVVNAWKDSGRGWQNLKAGNYGQAAIDYGNMGLNVAGELPFAKLAMAMMPAAKKGITAFHGSPHDFDRFSMDKIGTGEGAQAYGHGLYFAESEGVAQGYRDRVSKQVVNDPAYWADKALPPSLSAAETKEMAALGMKMRQEGNLPAAEMARWKQLQAVNRAYDDAIASAKPTGRMYQVRINANPDHFLDWDKPLSEQSAFVRDAIMRLPGIERADGLNTRLSMGDLIKRGLLPATYDHASPQFSQTMKDAGIPGVKYLDAGSRSTGEGSRNYVVFDDKLVEILKKYGWVPGAAIPAAAMLEYAGEGQQAPQM